MALIIKKPWRTQPTGPVTVDWTNPITQGMFLCWAGDQKGKTIHGPNGVASGTIGTQTTQQGRAATNNGEKVSAGTANNFITFRNLTSPNLTFLVVGGRNSTLAANQVAELVATRSSTAGTGVEIYAGNGFGDATKWSASDFAGAATNTANALNGILSVNTGAAPTTIVNGSTYNYAFALSNASQGGGHTLLAKAAGTNDYACDVFCSLYVVWTRRVSNAELVSLSINPYQIFRPLELQLNSPPAPRLYYVIGPTSGWTDPTPAEVKAGTLAGGAAATASGSESGPLTSQTVTFIQAATGLTSATNYNIALVQYNDTTYSNVAVGSFATTGGGTNYPVSLTESSAIAETQTAATTYPVSRTETAAITETQTAATTYSVSRTETAATSTTETAATTYPVSVSESAAIAETQDGILVFPVSVSESAAISETQSVATTYAPSLTESAAVAATEAATTDYTVSRTESAATATTETGVVSTSTTVDETATITDTQTGAVTYAVSVSESAAITDAQIVGSAFVVSISESLAIADTQTATTTYTVSRSETAATTTTETAATSYAPSVSETVAIADTNSAATAFIVSALETAAFAEQAIATLIYNVTRTETAALTETQIGYKNGWTEIDDTQTANWQNVSTAQTPGWQGISTAQTPNWQTVSTVQTPSWQDVDTAQAPGWTIIPTQ